MPASRRAHLRALPAPETQSSTVRASFPSSRQAKAIGLKRATYPAYIQWAVDYDYTAKLNEAERAFLAAFSEEHYRGWRLKNETQVLPPDALRQANAEHAQRRKTRCQDRRVDVPCTGEFEAASRGLQEHELRGRNLVEDEMVRWLDRPRRVK